MNRPAEFRGVWAVLMLAFLAGACGGTCPRPIRVAQDLDDPNPSRRTTAVAAVRDLRDTSRVPVLIEMLDDADPAVRLAAYSALVELTGRETDYRPWMEAPARRDAVVAWRAWWAARDRETEP